MAHTSQACLTGNHQRCLLLDCPCSVCHHQSPKPTGRPASSTTRRAAYSREYRATHADAATRNRLGNQAHGKALRRLAQLHAQDFQALLDHERDKVGLPPVGAVRPGRKPSWSGERLEP